MIAGGLIFGNEIILAIFHSFGSLPSRSEQLKIAVKTGASSDAWSFKTQAGMLSGPEALFGLILRRAFNVVCILIIHSSGSEFSSYSFIYSFSSRVFPIISDLRTGFGFISSTLRMDGCMYEGMDGCRELGGREEWRNGERVGR